MGKPIAEALFSEIIETKAADGDLVVTSRDDQGNPVTITETPRGRTKTQASLRENLTMGLIKYLRPENLN